MTTNNIITLNRWQDFIEGLPWNPTQAEASAKIALSKFDWRDVSKDDAIESILKLPQASYARENPWILRAAWEHVSRQNNGEPPLILELEPLFDAAA